MQFFIICSVLFAVSIDSSLAFFNLLPIQPSSGCTLLVEVPLTPYRAFYKAELFKDLNAKLYANQDRYNRNLGQVWVDAPDPNYCSYTGYRPGIGRCCLNGFYNTPYEWRVFASGEKKKIANEMLFRESQSRHLDFYNVWTDAPERFCRR